MRDLAGLALLPLGEFLTEVLGPLGPPFWPAISAADTQAEPAAEPPDVRAASVAEASNSTCAAKSASGSAGDGGDGGEGGGERRPLTKQERERAEQHPADGAALPAAPNSSRSKPSIDGADGAVSLAEVNGGQPAPAAEAPFWPADYSKRAASESTAAASSPASHADSVAALIGKASSSCAAAAAPAVGQLLHERHHYGSGSSIPSRRKSFEAEIVALIRAGGGRAVPFNELLPRHRTHYQLPEQLRLQDLGCKKLRTLVAALPALRLQP